MSNKVHFISFLSGITPRIELQALSVLKKGSKPVVWIWGNSFFGTTSTIFKVIPIYTNYSKLFKSRKLRSIFEILEFTWKIKKIIPKLVENRNIIQINHPFLLLLTNFFYKREIKIVYDVVEFYQETYAQIGLLGKIFSYILNEIEKKYLPYVDKVICVTSKNNWLKKRLEKMHLKEVKEIWNLPSLDIDKISSIKLPEYLRDKKLIAYIGGLTEQKGASIFGKIVKNTVSSYPKAHFIIIGSILRNKVNPIEWLKEQGIDKHCTFIPWLNQRELVGFLKHAKIGLILSQPTGTHLLVGKGGGRKLFTYFACKVPVIAPNFSEAWEVVKEEKAGIMVDTTNSEDITNAILFLLRNEEIREKMATSAYLAFKNKYHWEKNMENEYLSAIGI